MTFEVPIPVQQTRLAGVGRQTANGVNPRGHADVFVPELYGFGAVHDLAPEGAARLEAGEDHVTLLAPEIVLEVMPDTPAVAHAAAGDDDGAGAHAVDGHGLRGGAAELEVGR